MNNPLTLWSRSTKGRPKADINGKIFDSLQEAGAKGMTVEEIDALCPAYVQHRTNGHVKVRICQIRKRFNAIIECFPCGRGKDPGSTRYILRGSDV